MEIFKEKFGIEEIKKQEEPKEIKKGEEKMKSIISKLDLTLEKINKFSFGGRKEIHEHEEELRKKVEKYLERKIEKLTEDIDMGSLREILKKLEKDYSETPAGEILKACFDKRFIRIKE